MTGLMRAHPGGDCFELIGAELAVQSREIAMTPVDVCTRSEPVKATVRLDGGAEDTVCFVLSHHGILPAADLGGYGISTGWPQ